MYTNEIFILKLNIKSLVIKIYKFMIELALMLNIILLLSVQVKENKDPKWTGK